MIWTVYQILNSVTDLGVWVYILSNIAFYIWIIILHNQIMDIYQFVTIHI